MTVAFFAIPENPDAEPTLAIAFRISSKRGLSVQFDGIRRFDLTKQSIESVVAEVAVPSFKWKEPKFGKMKTALSIGLDVAVTTCVFVLDKSLDAEFSNSLPAIFAANETNAERFCNVRTWPEAVGPDGGPTIASMTSMLDVEHGHAEFAIALDNVGVTHPDRQPYRTPIIIDPDVRHPPIGGTGGGEP